MQIIANSRKAFGKKSMIPTEIIVKSWLQTGIVL